MYNFRLAETGQTSQQIGLLVCPGICGSRDVHAETHELSGVRWSWALLSRRIWLDLLTASGISERRHQLTVYLKWRTLTQHRL